MAKDGLSGQSKPPKQAFKDYMTRHDKRKNFDAHRYLVNPNKGFMNRIKRWFKQEEDK